MRVRGYSRVIIDNLFGIGGCAAITAYNTAEPGCACDLHAVRSSSGTLDGNKVDIVAARLPLVSGTWKACGLQGKGDHQWST